MAVTLHFTNGVAVQVADAASVIPTTNPNFYELSSALPGATGGNVVGGGPVENLDFYHYEN